MKAVFFILCVIAIYQTDAYYYRYGGYRRMYKPPQPTTQPPIPPPFNPRKELVSKKETQLHRWDLDNNKGEGLYVGLQKSLVFYCSAYRLYLQTPMCEGHVAGQLLFCSQNCPGPAFVPVSGIPGCTAGLICCTQI